MVFFMRASQSRVFEGQLSGTEMWILGLSRHFSANTWPLPVSLGENGEEPIDTQVENRH